MPDPSGQRIRTARLLKAMAHPLRLRILDELAQYGERCVCELAALCDADESTTSRHLTRLRVVGLVADQRRGPQVFYRLSGPHVLRLLEAVHAVSARQTVSPVEHCFGAY